jgi:hypothetical protein
MSGICGSLEIMLHLNFDVSSGYVGIMGQEGIVMLVSVADSVGEIECFSEMGFAMLDAR